MNTVNADRSVDVRTRTDQETAQLDPCHFFEHIFPNTLQAGREHILPGARQLELPPAFSVEVDGNCWTTLREDDGIKVFLGQQAGAARVRLTTTQLSDLVRDQITPMSLFTQGLLDMPEGGLGELLHWWLILRSAMDEQPIYTSGSVSFVDLKGGPLKIDSSFTPESDNAEMAHFLRETGFLHIQGLFTQAEMNQISEDMDCFAPQYTEGDTQSWWATVKGGERRLVRMLSFDQRSEATARLLQDERFVRLRNITQDHHALGTMKDNLIEALIKPINVVEGISDTPWHKDCALGRHSYDCCSLTVGISVTGADERSGQLRVLAGSNRALIWPAIGQPGIDLPDVSLATETGDVTLHTSCTLHMAQPPLDRERRVLYTSFGLPDRSENSARERQRVREARESAPVTVSQEPSEVEPSMEQTEKKKDT